MIVRLYPYRWIDRALCWILAAVMITAPAAWAVAQNPTERGGAMQTRSHGQSGQPVPLDLTCCTDRAFAALVLHPRRVLTDPTMELLPIEVMTAAGIQKLGIDPVEIEKLQAFIEPPMAGPPSFAVVVRFAKPFQMDQLNPQLREHTMPGTVSGKEYLQSQHPVLPSFLMLDDSTLVVASDEMLQRIVAGRAADATSPLLKQLEAAPGGHDAYAIVCIDMVRPLIDMGIQQAHQSKDVPPPIRPLLDLPALIRAVEASLNLVSKGPTQLTVYANDEDAAKKMERIVDDGLAMIRQQMLAEFEKQETSEDPVEKAMANYMKRISDRLTEVYRPVRDGDRFVLGGQPPEGQQQLQSMAVIGILVALLLPAVQSAREAARRTACFNNMKQIILCLLNYESAYGHLPAQANYDKDGKPLLSWRVHILPFMEQQALYEQFHLDEPWDSPHNKTLIDKMPEVFRCPSSPHAGPKTNYLAPYGKGLIMEGKKGIKIHQIKDGMSNTIAVVEVDDDHAVIWTKPEDLVWNPENPMAGLGSNHPGIFGAAYADGSVRAIDKTTDLNTLKQMFTRDARD